MASELLLTIPNMKRKDPRHSFNDAERYAIDVLRNYERKSLYDGKS